MTYRRGDVYRYTPKEHWCREGMAIANADGALLDTYWQHSGDNHQLRDGELATAEFVFNLSDYQELAYHDAYKWHDYNPADRQVVTAQHGWCRRLFIRKGSTPDLKTKIQNASDAVTDAEEKLNAAQSWLECRRRELTELEQS